MAAADIDADVEQLRQTISDLRQALALERELHEQTRARVLVEARLIGEAAVRLMLMTEPKEGPDAILR